MDDRKQVKTGWMMKSAYIITSVFLAVVIIFFIFATPIVEAFLKDYLRSSTKNKYTLIYDKFSYNPVIGTVSVRNLRLSLNSKIYTENEINQTNNMSMQELELSGINPLEILFRKKFHLSRVYFRRPDIEIISKENEEEESSRSSIADFLGSDFMSSLKADEINIYDGTLNVHKKQLKNNFIEVLGFGAYIRNLGSYGNKAEKKIRADQIELTAKKYRMNLSKFYYVEFDGARINSRDSLVKIDSIRLVPRYDIMRYAAEKNVETDRMDLTVDDIAIDGVSILEILNDRIVNARRVDIGRLIYKDWRVLGYPLNTEPGMYSPLQLLEEIKYNLKINRLVLDDGSITYEEIHKENALGGKVWFSNLKLDIRNMTNIGLKGRSKQHMTLRGSMYLSGQGDVKFLIDVPLILNSNYLVRGSVGAYDLRQLNRFVENVEQFRFEKGDVKSSDFSFSVGPVKSEGSVVVTYDDLNIKKLDTDPKDNEKKTDVITSFFLNTFMLESKNPRNGSLEKGEIDYTKDPYQNITSYWWKSLRSGILNLAGLKGKAT